MTIARYGRVSRARMAGCERLCLGMHRAAHSHISQGLPGSDKKSRCQKGPVVVSFVWQSLADHPSGIFKGWTGIFRKDAGSKARNPTTSVLYPVFSGHTRAWPSTGKGETPDFSPRQREMRPQNLCRFRIICYRSGQTGLFQNWQAVRNKAWFGGSFGGSLRTVARSVNPQRRKPSKTWTDGPEFTRRVLALRCGRWTRCANVIKCEFGKKAKGPRDLRSRWRIHSPWIPAARSNDFKPPNSLLSPGRAAYWTPVFKHQNVSLVRPQWT